MNLATKAFKAAIKNFIGKKLGVALGESATEVALRASKTITDEAEIKDIGKVSKEFSEAVGANTFLPKDQRTVEQVARTMTGRDVELGKAAAAKYLTESLDDKIDKLVDLSKSGSPDERKRQIEDIQKTVKAYFADPKYPIKTDRIESYIESGDYVKFRQAFEEACVEKALIDKDNWITEGLRDVFVDPAVVDNMIKTNRTARLKSIFVAEKGGLSKFDQRKKEFLQKATKGMPAEQQKATVKAFDERLKLPDNIETADPDELYKQIDWYNSVVPEKETVHYNRRDMIIDKVRIWAAAGENLEDFASPLSAQELTKSKLASLTRKGSGLVTNLGRAYGWFKGAEDFTAKSLGRAAEYMEQLPKFRTRNNELLMSAGIAMDKYGDGLSKESKADLQNRIRSYIEGLRGDKLSQVPYGVMSNALTIDAELAQKLNLTTQDVEFANKIINAFRLSKKHMDLIEDGLYDEANRILHRFSEINGLELEDVSMLNKKHPTFGFVRNYFPIVPTEAYKDQLEKLKASSDNTGIAHIARQQLDLIKSGMDDLTFFTKMRRLDKDSFLKTHIENRLSPSQEILTHAKAVNNFYKARGYKYFDQIDLAHSMYNVLNNYGKDEANARWELLNGLRQQYDQAMNPKGLGEGFVPKLLSKALTLEMTMALASPRMALFNALQGFELGSSMVGYRNHIKATIKNMFGAAGWALHQKLGGEQGYFGNARFIEKCYEGKLSKGLLVGDDAIVAQNIGIYYRDEPITSLVNMADANYLLTKDVQEGIRARNPRIAGILEGLKDFANYGFMLSEKIARASTIDASTRHFLETSRRTLEHIKAHPEISNPEAVKFFARELHLDALSNPWKVDKILNNLKTADNLTEALTDNKLLQRMSQDYAFACVKHQIFEYDQINQSWLKAKWKNTSAYLGIPLTFKSWGMHFTEYFAGLGAAAYNGDYKPLVKFTAQALGTVVAGTYVSQLADDKKYKKGQPHDLSDWVEKGLANAAKYHRGRNVLFVPVSMAQQPLDELAGLASPVVGGVLWGAAATINKAASWLPGNDPENVVFPYLESQAADTFMNAVTLRKARDVINNMRELGWLAPEKKEKRKKKKK